LKSLLFKAKLKPYSRVGVVQQMEAFLTGMVDNPLPALITKDWWICAANIIQVTNRLAHLNTQRIINRYKCNIFRNYLAAQI